MFERILRKIRKKFEEFEKVLRKVQRNFKKNSKKL